MATQRDQEVRGADARKQDRRVEQGLDYAGPERRKVERRGPDRRMGDAG